MSNLSLDFSDSTFQPLAARMRPENLAQYIGQQHLLAAGKPLPRAIEAGHLHSMILWGPPGTGKTTLAEVIARYASADVERISAVTSGVKEIREAIERARQNRNAGRRTILFVDEVHRFNKSQQDAFLPHIEDGTITFIGATTENPSFELNSALLSRARVYLLKSLTIDDIEQVLDQAMQDKTRGYGDQDIVLPDETRRAIAELVNGDARRALNTLEMMADMAEVDDSGKRVLLPALLTEIAGERSARFDNKGDRFYDLISALHKSVRGSAPDAALYWYARIITAEAIRCTWRVAAWRSLRKMSVMPIRVRCRLPLPPGIVLPALARLKAKGRSLRLSFISPARRRATLSIPLLKLHWPTRVNVLIMTFQYTYAMRRPN
ncbi:Holliday junction DNA helicase [Salmonella enterica subsp. arizonae]|uniref:Replication-associated recombination protein A n=1 Tax=Salmonella enterica subsp. arizonae TaxID=59203 RepID=A0A379SGN5_SALER|nr:Holliday junction DNA helicase [Salmonella enterica subsp. arizonae]